MDSSASSKRMLTYYSSSHVQHAPSVEFLHGQLVPYFEKPGRAESIKTALTNAGLVDVLEPHLQLTRDVLSAVHDPAMIAYLEHHSEHCAEIIRQDYAIYHMADQVANDPYFYESLFPPRESIRSAQGRDMTTRSRFIYDSVSPIGAATWIAAYHSANLAYCGAISLLEGQSQAYALCRPPGHHAGAAFMGGYCYLNNAALAAHALLSMGRVAIIDIDYHHGNGTQDIFWDDPRVFFASIHAHPAQDYPYYAGYREERGGENAYGTTLNLPLPHGTGPDPYLAALNTACAEVSAFKPASLIVSLGFDTFKDDPIASFKLEVDTFAAIGSRLASLNLPTLYIQEGGYCLPKLGEMAVAFFGSIIQA